MHEIITLQLGQSSNYLATHFWNTQESYFTYGEDDAVPAVDPDIHWRAGLGIDGTETFLPRTVIYDLKGGFGSLRKINALYDPGDTPKDSSLTWEGETVLHHLPEVTRTAYQQSLDDGKPAQPLQPSTIRYWSDFSRVFYHPKSLNQLYDYELNSTIRPFDRWDMGQGLFQSLEREEDMVDRDFRPFVEEADQMQGVQLITSLDDAWGGFAAEYLERMRDEYPKSIIWTWASQKARLSRGHLSNVARSVVAMAENASMLIPLTAPVASLPPYVQLAQGSEWQTSALLSTAVETATFASRAKAGPSETDRRHTLGSIVEGLNLNGKQNLGRLQMSVTSSAVSVDGQASTLPDNDTAGLDIDLSCLGSLRNSPRLARRASPHYFGQFRTCRAILSHDIDGGSADGVLPGFHHRTDRNITRYCSDIAFPLPDSFPGIYTGKNGESLSQSAGVATILSTDSKISDYLKGLSALVATSIGIEDREDICSSLAQLAEEYQDGWSSGSDEGEDD